jgi:TrmH RNA methyltransferase
MSRGSRTHHHNTTEKKQREKSDSKKKSDRRSREVTTKFYGIQACRAIFRERRNEIRRVFVNQEQSTAFHEVLEWSKRRGIPHKVVESDELSRIAATEHHEGVCCEAKPLQPFSVSKLLSRLDAAPKSCVLVLEGVENPHNVGAILRTGCFFGVSAVVLISQQVSTLSGATCRVAEGAAESLPVSIVRAGDEVLAALRKRGYTLVATTPHQARSLYSVRWPSKVALLFGAEGCGLSEATLASADERVVIPRAGPVESLNVGAAVASVLTEVARARVGS